MKKSRNNKWIVILLIVIVAIIATLCILFATGTISLNSNTTNTSQQSSGSESQNSEKTDEKVNVKPSNKTTESNATSVVQSKIVEGITCKNSETTFNGITVKVEHTQGTATIPCSTTAVLINGNDVKNDNGTRIESYEFFGKYVLIRSGSSGDSVFTIYNTNSNSTELKIGMGTTENLDGYFVDSYSTNGNTITLNMSSCGAQCGEKGMSTSGTKAIYKIEYSNGSLSAPTLVEKTSV
ncbi:hypothetical protein IJG78_02605 [Candidatus Saccharibacteria bacterium]|nr:hypothetical protein [Candidatus Saccharibacteria bacterium]